MVGNRALDQLAEAFTAEDAKSAEWTEQTTAYTLTGDVREGGHTTVLAPAHPSKDARLSRASVNQRAQVLRNQLLVSQDDTTVVARAIPLVRVRLY